MWEELELSKHIHELFEKCSRLEKITKFVQRSTAKLRGLLFVKVMIFESIKNPMASLENYVQKCTDLDPQVKISSQGMHKRINIHAVELMETLFKQAIKSLVNTVKLELNIFKEFTEVYILDSTSISLPEKLSKVFKGCGGSASEAIMKVQSLFAFLTGNYIALALRDGISSDISYAELTLQYLKKGSLLLFDLGYLSTKFLLEIVKRACYFICRYKFGTSLYLNSLKTGKLEKLYLGQLLKKHIKIHFELNAILKSKEGKQINTRVVFIPVPEQTANLRRRKAIRNSKKKGHTPNKEALALLDWCIFLTNVPSDILNIEDIAQLYRLRWQIELSFKVWKSIFAIDRIHARKREERLLCEFYAKMIGIILFNFLCAPLRVETLIVLNRELSIFKAFAYFQEESFAFAKALCSYETLVQFLQKTYKNLMRFALKTKRKKRKSTLQLLMEFQTPQNSGKRNQNTNLYLDFQRTYIKKVS